MTRPDPRTSLSRDSGQLASTVAAHLLARLREIQDAGREPHIALTGGTIAGAIHREVARLSPDSAVDWTRVVVWWGDERFLDSEDPERNAWQAQRDLLAAVEATQVHPMPSTQEASDVDHAALLAGEDLRSHGAGQFDVVMLGMGGDGHVASLFPGHPALAVDDQVAVGVRHSPKPPPERISLTFGALNRAHSVWFLVSGDQKAQAVASARSEQGDLARTPARGVRGSIETVWFVDRDAASLLRR